MSKRVFTGVFFALISGVFAITPVMAQGFYVNPHDHYGTPYGNPYGNPHYNNYNYREYAPYQQYGYRRAPNHTVRNVAIGAAIGAAVGLLASHHGHSYN